MQNQQGVSTTPFEGQKPGTSGLRKKVKVFEQPRYLENFVQSVFNSVPERGLLVVGGDGRYHNPEAIQTIIRMAVANGFSHLMIGQNGILSTPAVSNLIRKNRAMGGLILSASHNPAGPDEDFGIKFNNASGSPAPEQITDAIFENTKTIDHYLSADVEPIDLSVCQKTEVQGTTVEVVDSVTDYVSLMQELFDFDKLKAAFSDGRLSLCFDAMHAVTGPYAKAIFEDVLGARPGSVINATPLPDFNGGHPDPNLVHAKELIDLMAAETAPVLGAASDGDGDRNLIVGQQFFVSPSDSLAAIAEHARVIPQFANGLSGVARSMPTSTALDRVAEAMGIECYETPTGWKFFGNLLDHSRINLCGEESFGTSGDHVREKDGIWAVLCWLTLIMETAQSPQQILESLWQKYGRSYYCRHDFEAIDSASANQLMLELSEKVARGGIDCGNYQLLTADVFEYTDPTDQSVTKNQGIRLIMQCGSRIIFRLSGTGTRGATLRVYLEKVSKQGEDHHRDTFRVTDPLLNIAMFVARIEAHTGMQKATIMT
ncbi:MAG: alpha-D-glucose phosphate-specific phosphoglucomutase [Gammaproteobacteria bacterium]|nr:MAG: alpha-D-glucose phosphate-specific phosphoglucomutase [Pseudomonadota bacterium]PIE38348.1 MAG: alpha-D-glucose phosphate-specific phosphoglucomutase [Gammaproteobacteria bacterium]